MAEKHLEETERRKEKKTYTELILHHGSIAKSRQCSNQSVCIKVFFFVFLLHQILIFHLFFNIVVKNSGTNPEFIFVQNSSDLVQPPKEASRWALLEKFDGSNHCPFSSQVYVLFEQLCAPLISFFSLSFWASA